MYVNVNGKGDRKGGVEAVVPLELDGDVENRRGPGSPQTVLAGSVWAVAIKRSRQERGSQVHGLDWPWSLCP